MQGFREKGLWVAVVVLGRFQAGKHPPVSAPWRSPHSYKFKISFLTQKKHTSHLLQCSEEAVIKTIPKNKKCKRAKWLSEEALQIVEKRREAKGKGEKERYIHLNAEFQRTARRDKIAFLSDQCKKIEENNRMRKARNLLKKIRYTKGKFHAKMGTIKNRYGLDLTEAEYIKKRWQEYIYTEKL